MAINKTEGRHIIDQYYQMVSDKNQNLNLPKFTELFNKDKYTDVYFTLYRYDRELAENFFKAINNALSKKSDLLQSFITRLVDRTIISGTKSLSFPYTSEEMDAINEAMKSDQKNEIIDHITMIAKDQLKANHRIDYCLCDYDELVTGLWAYLPFINMNKVNELFKKICPAAFVVAAMQSKMMVDSDINISEDSLATGQTYADAYAKEVTDLVTECVSDISYYLIGSVAVYKEVVAVLVEAITTSDVKVANQNPTDEPTIANKSVKEFI